MAGPCYAPRIETQTVGEMPTNTRRFVVAIETEAAPSIVVPDCGYTVSVDAPSFATTATAPVSAGGNFAPVDAAVVETTVKYSSKERRASDVRRSGSRQGICYITANSRSRAAGSTCAQNAGRKCHEDSPKERGGEPPRLLTLQRRSCFTNPAIVKRSKCRVCRIAGASTHIK